MKEAIEQMRQELGEDAVILSTRTLVKTGGTSAAVEITGALDARNGAEPTPARAITPQKNSDSERALKIQRLAESFAREHSSGKRAANVLPQQNGKTMQSAGTEMNNFEQSLAFHRLHQEISTMKDTLQHVAKEVRIKHSSQLNDICQKIYQVLIEGEIREDLALEIIGAISEDKKITSLSDAALAARFALAGKLRIAEPIKKSGKRQTFAFVGTTGSGKTTTIAKLATIAKLVLNANVFLISADTYRVGGAEQLQTIAAIANIPFQAVYSTQELRQTLVRETDYDFVFIDTVGRSPKNPAHLQEIKMYMEAAAPDSVFLVQSATSSESMFTSVLEKFAMLSPTHLIITKLDEAATIGALIGGLRKSPLPLAYFTTGQMIPDDIEPAGRKKLADLLIPLTLELEEIEGNIHG